MLFRPEHRTHLEHPLIRPHHGLLVDLGGLGQTGFFAEVVQPEEVGASLRTGADDLRGVDFGEALPGQIVPEGLGQPLLELEHRPAAQVPEDHRTQGQLSIQADIQFSLGQGDGHGGGGGG